MNQRERNEWIERAKERVLDNVMDTEHYIKDVMFLYDDIAYDLETEINAMFQKFAKDNVLTESEANKLLSGEEHRHWKKRIDEYVKEAKGNSKTLLELNVLSAKSRISRKEKLLADVYQKMIDLSKDTETKLTDILGNVFKTNYYRSFHDLQSVMKVGFNVGKIDERTVKKILEKPWEGKRFSSRVWKNTDKLAAVARWEIGRGFTAGHSVQKMTKAIKDVMESGKYVTERLVRTEASRFANQGGAEAYKELGIEKYEVLGGGCGDCQEMNTKTFKFDEAVEGDTMPPFHPRCKCTIRADVDRSLFEKREGAEELQNNMKFKEWKEKYVDNEAVNGKLSESEKYGLISYISPEAYKINENLRNGISLTESQKVIVEGLDNALKKMPKFQGNLARDVDFKGYPDGKERLKTFWNMFKEGNDVTFKEYISTTSSSNFSLNNPDVRIFIQNAKNGRDIRKYNESEQEILYERNSSFLVITKEEYGGKKYIVLEEKNENF